MTDRNKEIAITIAQQLGGVGKLSAMTSAHSFVYGEGSLTFKFKGSRTANCVKIQLTSLDLYDITFYKIGRNLSIKTVTEIDGAYSDQLIGTFEDVTGLRLSL